ncbi:MAG: hypothetical protein NTZ16_12685 [Verrucomicrobia bacterium]|nr:hypothetical protein [Verrucomicrobiota bacterium]
MSTPILPTVLRSPAIFVLDGVVYYFDQSGAKVKTTRGTVAVKDDMFGIVGNASEGGPVVDITFTPTAMIRNLDKMLPFSGAGIAGWYAGQSIFKGVGYFHTKAGTKTAYARAGILKPPTLYLHPTKPFFGPMTVRCLNKIDVQPTDAAALATLSATAFDDASFDETLLARDVYSAALGARIAPFNAMGGRDGFEIEPIFNTEDVKDSNLGTVETLITEIGYKARFAANNLTEAQLAELANWQGASAIIAGQDVAVLDEDLVIDGDPITVTLYKAGVTMAENGYGVKLDRNGQIEFVNRMSFAAGVPNPLIDLTVNL